MVLAVSRLETDGDLLRRQGISDQFAQYAKQAASLSR